MSTTLAHVANSAQTISRERNPGLDLTIIERRHLREAHLTLRPLSGEPPAVMINRLGGALQETGATPVRFEVFGALAARQATLDTLETTLGPIAWPVMWKEEANPDPGGVSGLHVLAIAGAGVETIELEGRIVGCCFNDGWARHCVLGGLGPEDVSAPARVQTRKTYEQLAGALRVAGMAMSHVVRTWVFLDDIRASYGVFNAARTEFYQRHKLFTELAPASSVVGARRPAGAVLVAGAWAIQPANGSLTVQAVPSPLQCPAQNYDACFSRAVEITTPCHRRLLVSATAGLDPNGRTSAIGDIQGQVDLALRAVAAILASRRLSLFDVTRATAYFKRAADMRVFTDWCVAHDALFLPALMIQSELCRKDLLFEIELDAIAPTARHSPGMPPADDPVPADDKRAGVASPAKKRACKGGSATLRRPAARVADGGRR